MRSPVRIWLAAPKNQSSYLGRLIFYCLAVGTGDLILCPKGRSNPEVVRIPRNQDFVEPGSQFESYLAAPKKNQDHTVLVLFLRCGRFERSNRNSPVDCCSPGRTPATPLFSPFAKGENANESAGSSETPDSCLESGAFSFLCGFLLV